MIRFNKHGKAEVHFNIYPLTATRNRSEVCVPLDVYIALSKTSTTLEELRETLFLYKSEGSVRRAKVKEAVV
jgi:hypothetical protein